MQRCLNYDLNNNNFTGLEFNKKATIKQKSH
jgi:hypothetical protein